MKITSLQQYLTIEKIEIKNFSSYEYGEIELNNGITVIYGERNGSGKTTFAEALSRGITDEYLFKIKDIDKIRHGSDQFLITIYGQYQSNLVEIRCIRTKKSAKIEVINGNETLSGQEATEFLQNIVTNEEFKRLVYINGSDIDILIKGTPSARSKVLDKVFGIQSIIIAIDSLKIRPVTDKIAQLSIKLDQKVNEKSNIFYILSKNDNKEKIEHSINNEKKRLNKIKNNIEILNKRIKSFHTKRKEYLIAKKSKNKIEKEIYSMEMKLENHIVDLENINTKLHQLESAINNIVQSKNKIQEYIDKRDKIIEDSNKKIKKAQLQPNNDLSSIIRKEVIDNNNDICPVCANPIDIEKINIIHLNTSKSSKNKEKIIIGLKNRIERAYIEKQGLEEYINRKKVIQSRASQKKIIIKKIKIIIKKEKEKLEKINIPDFNSNLYDELKTKYAIKNGQRIEIENNIHNLEIKLQNVQNSEKMKNTISIIEDEIHDIKKEITNQKYKLSKIRQYRNGLKSILTNIRREMVDQINPLIQQWINMFNDQSIDDIPYISYQLNVIEKSTEKTHTIKYDDVALRYGVPISFDALSTGQKAMCSLALIFAVEDVSFHQINLMIFDEIHTSGIDDKGLSEILNIISQLVEKTKILLIERRPEVVEYLSEISSEKKIPFDIYQVHAVNGISHIVKNSDMFK